MALKLEYDFWKVLDETSCLITNSKMFHVFKKRVPDKIVLDFEEIWNASLQYTFICNLHILNYFRLGLHKILPLWIQTTATILPRTFITNFGEWVRHIF